MKIWRVSAAAIVAATYSVAAAGAPAGSQKHPELRQGDTGFHEGRPFTAFASITATDQGIAIDDNHYTNLEITRTPLAIDANTKYLSYAKRDLIWRLGIAKKYSFTVTLKADAAKFSATVPLMTREYESSRKKGENFSRAIEYDNLGQPLFLIGSDPKTSVASFKLSVNVSSDTSSDVVARSLALLTRAMKTVSPTSAVLTTLSEDGNKNLAEALDNAIGSIYSTSVKESLDFDISLKAGKKYKVEIFGPIYEVNETFHSVKLGEWMIAFSPGRPSIFSTKTERSQVLTEARGKYANILSFELLNNLGAYGSIASYLKQQDWWAGEMTKLADGNAGTATANQIAFCRKVRASIATLGLNDIDGRLVAEAVTHSEYVPPATTAGFDSQIDCRVQAQ